MSQDTDALREAAQAVLNRIDRTVYRDNVGMRAGSDVDPVWLNFRAEATKMPEADGMGWALRVKDELTRRMLSDTPEARATAAETALAAMTERVDDAETRADELASQCDRLLAQRDAAETALAAMMERVKVLEEGPRTKLTVMLTAERERKDEASHE